MDRRLLVRCRATVLACLWAAVSAAGAGSISVSPIRVEFAPGQRSVTMSVRSHSDRPTVVQVQTVSWSQASDEDRLEPTTDLLVSPPIFEIAPGAAQIVRIAMRRPGDADRERAYRLLVTEVPGPRQPGFNGAQFALKFSLPVFVDGGVPKASPRIEWSGVRTADGALALTAFNTGSKHVQVLSLDVMQAGDAVDGRFAGLWYILPGQRRTVNIAPAPGRTIPTGAVRIRAETDGGVVAADVALDPR